MEETYKLGDSEVELLFGKDNTIVMVIKDPSIATHNYSAPINPQPHELRLLLNAMEEKQRKQLEEDETKV